MAAATPPPRPVCFAAVDLAPALPGVVPGWPRVRALRMIRRELDGVRWTRTIRIVTGLEDLYGPAAAGRPGDRAVRLPAEQAALVAATMTRGTYMIGLGTDQLTGAVQALLHACGIAAPWHTAIDVRHEVGATLRVALNRRTTAQLAALLGVEIDPFADRGGLDDAEIAETLFDAARCGRPAERPGHVRAAARGQLATA